MRAVCGKGKVTPSDTRTLTGIRRARPPVGSTDNSGGRTIHQSKYVGERADILEGAGNADSIVAGDGRDIAAGELLFDGFRVVTPGDRLKEDD